VRVCAFVCLGGVWGCIQLLMDASKVAWAGCRRYGGGGAGGGRQLLMDVSEVAWAGRRRCCRRCG
jgi:hypothetical protein